MNRSCLTAIALAASAFACASWDGIASSIHFYSGTIWLGPGKPTLDFGRLPQPLMINGWNAEMVRAGTPYGSYYGSSVDMGTVMWLMTKARNFEQAKRYDRALACYRAAFDLNEQNQVPFYQPLPYMVESRSAFRSLIRDKEEVYRIKSPKLPEYLRARMILFSTHTAHHAQAKASLKALEQDPKLGPFAIYAGIEKHDRSAYLKLAENPKGPRAAAALIMAGRDALTQKTENAIPKDDIEAGEQILKRLLKEHPKSPYTASAYGWLGRASYLRNDFDGALKWYFKQAGAGESHSAYESMAIIYNAQGLPDREAVCRLLQRGVSRFYNPMSSRAARAVFFNLKEDESKRLQKAIRRDPRLLHGYLAFRLEDTTLDRHKERNLLSFALSVLKDQPNADRATLSRIAQLSYNAGKYRSAVEAAQQAQSRPGDLLDAQCAQYIEAASLSRLGRHSQAIRAYRSLAAKNPPEFLLIAAQENIAVLEERHGDIIEAALAYKNLKYDWDLAFLADAKLSLPELSRFIARLPKSERGVYQYTLGLRYLRQGSYTSARRAFLAVPKIERARYGISAKEDLSDIRFYFEDDKPPRDPLRLTAELSAFDQKYRRARTRNTKAQALYDKGAYIYKHRNLLFYSAGLWRGDRAWVLADATYTPLPDADDRAALVRHSWEHECLAQSLKLFDRVVKEYPQSKIMPKALYSASLSAERLGNLNEWWRANKGNLSQRSINYLTRIIKQYPRDPIAESAKKYKGVFLSR